MNSSEADVAIVGGGLSGLSLALQIKQVRPQTAVTVLEKRPHPVALAAHKVGESSLEIGADYFARVLGLEHHIKTAQLPKYGLRFFVRSDPRLAVFEGLELGTTSYNPTPSYQFDRGVFENFLARQCADAGVQFIDRSRVTELQLGQGDDGHLVGYVRDGKPALLRCRWIVDAAGRAGMLKRQLELEQDIGHKINAAWFRVAARVDIDTWYDDAQWREDGKGEGVRYLSTNHLMGRGYWVWLIPLSSGSTSIGIVADPRIHPLETFNSFARAMAWLERHEPSAAAAVARVTGPEPESLQDFLAVKHYSRRSRHLFSGQRWALTGDAGAFLDPLYSPGSDFIAMGNSYVCDLVRRQLDGEDVTERASAYEGTFFSLFENRLSVFEDQYPLLGNMKVMPVKVIWDYALYCTFFAFLWFNDKLADVKAMTGARPQLARAAALNRRVQDFLREWDRADQNPGPGGFVDHSKIEFLRPLTRHRRQALDEAAFVTRLSDNLDLMEQLASELVEPVIAACPDLAERRWPLPPPSDHLGDLFSTLGIDDRRGSPRPAAVRTAHGPALRAKHNPN